MYDELLYKKMNEAWIDALAKYFVFLGTKDSEDSMMEREAARDFDKAVNYLTGLELIGYKKLWNYDDENVVKVYFEDRRRDIKKYIIDSALDTREA